MREKPMRDRRGKKDIDRGTIQAVFFVSGHENAIWEIWTRIYSVLELSVWIFFTKNFQYSFEAKKRFVVRDEGEIISYSEFLALFLHEFSKNLGTECVGYIFQVATEQFFINFVLLG